MTFDKEDYLMHLLSGGDIIVNEFWYLGPISKYPETSPTIFINAVNEVSGGAGYILPNESFVKRLLNAGIIDASKKYWAHDNRFNYVVVGRISTIGYVLLVRHREV